MGGGTDDGAAPVLGAPAPGINLNSRKTFPIASRLKARADVNERPPHNGVCSVPPRVRQWLPPGDGPQPFPQAGATPFSVEPTSYEPSKLPRPALTTQMVGSARKGAGMARIALERFWCAALAAELGVNPLSLSRVPD